MRLPEAGKGYTLYQTKFQNLGEGVPIPIAPRSVRHSRRRSRPYNLQRYRRCPFDRALIWLLSEQNQVMTKTTAEMESCEEHNVNRLLRNWVRAYLQSVLEPKAAEASLQIFLLETKGIFCRKFLIER